MMRRLIPCLWFMLACGSSGFAQEKKASPELAALVETERAFAQTSVEKGVREAFLTFFADDGINFQPHPVNTKEAFRQRPAPPSLPLFTLNWQPMVGDLSAAGDLGFTTGPFIVTDHSPQQRPDQHGMFFSVWKKQSDGAWKVVVDVGISTPEAVAPMNIQFTAAVHPPPGKAHVKSKADSSVLLNAERDFNSDVRAHGIVTAYLTRLSADARLHRNDFRPQVGKEAIRAFLSTSPSALTCSPIKAQISSSGDLGYVYGKYELKLNGSPNARHEKGYYVRVWRNEGQHNWKLVADITQPLPPAEK